MKRILRAAFEILRLALARDRLGSEPPAPPTRSRGVLHVLFVSREPLGLDPEPPPTRTRRSLFRALFAREELPFDPEPAPSRRKGRLAAIFELERLDP